MVVARSDGWGIYCGIPWALVSLHSQCRRGPTGWRRWGPSPLRAVPDGRGNIFRRGSSGWRHWRRPPLRAQAQVFPLAQRMAPLGHVTNCLRRFWQPLLLHRSVAGTHIHVCMFMTSKLHDTMRGKPTSPLSTLLLLPSASSPSAGPRGSPPFRGRLCPALRALSRLSACSSCCPSLFPLCPAPSLGRCTTLYHALSPFCGIASIWPCLLPRRARDAAFPQPLALHLHESAPGAPPIFVDSGQSHCAQVTCHAALLPAPRLPLSLSSLVCPVLTLGPLSLAVPLTRTLHNNVRGTLSSPCPGPSCRCAHGAWQPSPSVGCLLAPSLPLSRPLCFSPLLGPPCPFLSPRALPYPQSLCSSAL